MSRNQEEKKKNNECGVLLIESEENDELFEALEKGKRENQTSFKVREYYFKKKNFETIGGVT